jgi:DnaJ-class molecular chaperone
MDYHDSKADYYKILELSPDASEDSVKKAYKRLARINHPDKGGSEEKFIKINEAYQKIQNSNPLDDFPDIFKACAEMMKEDFTGGVLEMLLGGGFGDLKNMLRPKGPTIKTTLKITLEELQDGGNFEVSYKIKKKTGNQISKSSMTPIGIMITTMQEEIEEIEKIVVTIEPCYNLKDGPLMTEFNRYEGDKIITNQLIINLILIDHEIFELVEGTFDLKIIIDITLKEALTGFERKIKLLNSEYVTIQSENIIGPYDTKRIPKFGLGKKGDLIISPRIEFPILLSTDTKNILEEIL